MLTHYKAVIREDLPEGKELAEDAALSIPDALIAAEQAANAKLADGLKLQFIRDDV